MTLLTDLDGMAFFVKIVEHGSLSAAGRALGLPKATVSRRLADLEATLGSELLHRTTRSQSLTDAGRMLYQRAAPLIAEAETAAGEIRALSQEPSGLVRITATVTFGQIVLMPIITRFLARWPKARIDLELSDAQLRIVEGGFDIAVRMGTLEDSELVARRLMRVEQRLVASKAYLTKNGRPKRPEDLKGHTALVSHPERDVWRFERGRERVEVRVTWRLAVTGLIALQDACKAGLGIALLPSIVVDPAIASRELIALDVGAKPLSADATALYPRTRTQSVATRSLLDAIATELTSEAPSSTGGQSLSP